MEETKQNYPGASLPVRRTPVIRARPRGGPAPPQQQLGVAGIHYDLELEYTRKLLEPASAEKMAKVKVDLGETKLDAAFLIR